MLDQYVRNADGTITFYIQNKSPGKDKEANWLPAPKGEFTVYMRIYWPKEEALNGSWKQPLMVKVDKGIHTYRSTKCFCWLPIL